MNNATMNMDTQISFRDPAFNSLGHVPRNEFAQSYGNSIFKFLRNRHIVFHKEIAPFYIPTNSAQVFQFFYILTNTYYFLFFFLIVAILMTVISLF